MMKWGMDLRPGIAVLAGLAALAVAPAASAQDAGPDASRIRMGRFEYVVIVQGNDVGTQSIEYSRAKDGRYQMDEEMDIQDGGKTGTYRFTGDLRPISVHQVNRIPMGYTAKVNTDLDYADGVVTGTATKEDESRMLAKKPVHDTVDEHTVDSNLVLPYLLASSLGAHFDQQLSVYEPRSGTSQITLAVRGEQSVKVPAGTFDAYQVDMDNGPAPVTFFVTRDAPHVLVKLQLRGQDFTVELTKSASE